MFFTPATHILRSGWRIGIFCIVMACFSGVAFFGANMLFPQSDAIVSASLCVALIGSSIIMVTIVDRRPFYSFGIAVRRRFLIEWGQGMLIAGVMMTFIVLSFFLSDSITIVDRDSTWWEMGRHLLNGVALFAFAGFFEELLFRGYIFQTLVEGTNRIIAIAVFSVFFGLFHLGNPNISVFSVLNIILAGIFLSLAYLRTGTLWFCTSLHLGWNFFQGSVYSLPVSGLIKSDILISRIALTGPEWLTGGAFGPEGGVAATIVLIIGSIVVWKAPWIKNENPPATVEMPISLTD
jgi:membrane protease YdiL (CAAX protease family)